MQSLTSREVPFYYRSVDWDHLVHEYPPAPDFFRTTFLSSPEELRALQERRLREAVKHAWDVPFYRRRWQAKGTKPEEVQTLNDVVNLPPYTVDDIRRSMEAYPPFGDYPGLDPRSGKVPLRLHSSGGTTGVPRPTFYAPWDREVGNILRARSYYFHGIRPGDFVMNTCLYATHNAAFSVHEALWYWLGCVPVSTSAGIVTHTRRALEIAKEWGVTAIIGFPDYLTHMAEQAQALGFQVGQDLKVRVLDSFGKADQVAKAWGCPTYDTYGMHEIQTIASQCPLGGGLHIWEDAFVAELVDVESGQPVPPGQTGSLVITALYKDAYPIVRYDTRDVTRFWPPQQCACGSWMQKIDPILGRGDQMIKLRGVNVWPEACGAILAQHPAMNGEYYCIVERQGARDEMAVLAEHRGQLEDVAGLRRELESLLRERLQVTIRVEPVPPGSLADKTGLHSAPKPKRLEDRRTASR